MKAEKLCVFCNHLDAQTDYDRGYYEGDCYPSGQLNCGKGHWVVEWGGDSFVNFRRQDLAEVIQMAKTCRDYSQASSEPQEGHGNG